MPPPAPPAAETPPRERAQLQRERSRWVAADWDELPGWGEDRAAELWPALLRGCARPAPGWARLCARAAQQAPANDLDAHLWLIKHLQPYRVESHEGTAEGLLTGYFEPELEARRQPDARFRVPLLAPPPDLQQRRPYYTRQQLDTEPLRSRQRALVYIEDPIDLQILQLQGSGRVRLVDADGGAAPRWLRMAFAGHNDQPLQPLGRALALMGEWRDGPAAPRAVVRDWARRNPQRINELLWANPRYVFFREEALPDPELGPRGAQGVPLSPGRSVAVDKASIPYGTPLWLDGGAGLRRLAMAQDTGSGIVGAVRADYFWGWGAEAEAQASRTKAPLRLWALWPRDDS
jgi:membrane-bound lytic murein transglycosylase A